MSSGVQHVGDTRLSVALAAAFRTFLNPDLAEQAHQAFLQEFNVSNGSLHPPTSAQALETPTKATANGNGKGGKRKREVNPDRKPRGISLFNLFQVKVMRMLRDSGAEFENTTGRLSASAQLWSAADQNLKDVFKSHYEPLVLRLNESKLHGGAKVDLHQELEEHDKQHPLDQGVVTRFAQLVASTAPLAPVAAAPGTAKKLSQAGTADASIGAPNNAVIDIAPPSENQEFIPVEQVEEPKKEKKKKKKSKDQPAVEEVGETESAKKKKKKKSKDGDAAQTPVVESMKKKKKTPAKDK